MIPPSTDSQPFGICSYVKYQTLPDRSVPFAHYKSSLLYYQTHLLVQIYTGNPPELKWVPLNIKSCRLPSTRSKQYPASLDLWLMWSTFYPYLFCRRKKQAFLFSVCPSALHHFLIDNLR